MRATKAAAFVLVATILVAVGWAVYRSGWRLWTSPRAPAPSAQNTEPPVVEFRELRSGPTGQAGSLLTIDRGGQATLQTLPLGPGSTTKRTHLSCDELAWLPQQMKLELAELKSNYGAERSVNEGELSVVYRWDGRESRVVWKNPESKPRPPWSWAGLVGPLEDIRRRAEETDTSALQPEKDLIVYGENSSGIVGTEHYSISIDKTGSVVATGGQGPLSYLHRGQTQLTPEELASLLRAIRETRFVDYQECYGKHAPMHERSIFLSYHWAGDRKDVLWMSPPADPKPPDGWFRIVEILDNIWTRTDKQTAPPSAPLQPAK